MAAKKRSGKKRRRTLKEKKFLELDNKIMRAYRAQVMKSGVDPSFFWKQPSIKKMAKKRGDLVQDMLLGKK